jgi:hypothetical protein
VALSLPDALSVYRAKFGRGIDYRIFKWACYNGYPEKLALVLTRAVERGAPLTDKEIHQQLEDLDCFAAMRAGAREDGAT